MIASVNDRCSSLSHADLQARFLTIQPRIELHARIYFRGIPCRETQMDRIAETIAIAWKWFVDLAKRDKDATHYPCVLASYAARAVCCGRRLCGQRRSQDVLHERTQARCGFRVESLAHTTGMRHGHQHIPGGQRQLDAFEERLRDNLQTPVDEQVQFRVDFRDWLRTRSRRHRRIIRDMSVNARTKELARRHGVTPSRISQLRREFQQDWKRFCGDS